MKETLEFTTSAAVRLEELIETKLTRAQNRDLLISLGNFNKSLFVKRSSEFNKKVKKYFGEKSILKIIIVGKTHTKEKQIIEYCKKKFNIDEDIISFVDENVAYGSTNKISKPTTAVIFANLYSYLYENISKELLKKGIHFAETRTNDGNRKRKLTLPTLHRAIQEIYFQRSFNS